MAIRNSAQLALAARKLASAKREPAIVDQADESASKLAVNGGFRAGKRKRGTSLLKRKPKQTAHAITYYVKDENGDTVASLRTLTYTKDA